MKFTLGNQAFRSLSHSYRKLESSVYINAVGMEIETNTLIVVCVGFSVKLNVLCSHLCYKSVTKV